MAKAREAETTFDRPTFLCDEQAWVRRLDYAVHAETVKTFKARLAEWLPFFPDATAAIETLRDDDGSYAEFRRGLQAERDKMFAGEEWAEKYGAVLLPRNAILATQVAEKYLAPWGAALVRVSGIEL